MLYFLGLTSGLGRVGETGEDYPAEAAGSSAGFSMRQSERALRMACRRCDY
jgi:hypothetical protein